MIIHNLRVTIQASTSFRHDFGDEPSPQLDQWYPPGWRMESLYPLLADSLSAFQDTIFETSKIKTHVRNEVRRILGVFNRDGCSVSVDVGISRDIQVLPTAASTRTLSVQIRASNPNDATSAYAIISEKKERFPLFTANVECPWCVDHPGLQFPAGDNQPNTPCLNCNGSTVDEITELNRVHPPVQSGYCGYCGEEEDDGCSENCRCDSCAQNTDD
jgi:hypothetical protein